MATSLQQPMGDPELDVPPDGRWWSRLRRSARALRLAVVAAPVAASTVGSVVVALLLPRPVRPLTTLLWWAAVLGAGVVALLVVRRVTVRLLPLATLLDLTLVFPEEAPSRFAIARRARSVDEALGVLDDLSASSSVQAAAEASLALVVALETHDSATRGHAERVRLLADLVGQELGVSEAERVRLRWGALLHDLGKLHVHGDILNKAGRPTAEEWEQLQQHPVEGDRLVQPLRPWLGDWVNAVLEHHERFDGGGYPHGRAGHEISLAGRIVGVVDAYETMTARRAYKQPMDAGAARSELVACAGGQFDPDIVRAFLSVSIPAPSRRSLLLGWLAQLPIVAALGRLPREPTAAMLSAGVATAAIVASGLGPAGAGEVIAAPDVPPPVAVDRDVLPRSSRDVSAPEETSRADVAPTADAGSPRGDAPGGPTAPGSPPAVPERPDGTGDEAPDPAPRPPDDPATDSSHRRARHAAASALYLGTGTTSAMRWLPLVTDEPAAGDVSDPEGDGVPGVALPTERWRPGPDRPPLAWTLQVPASAVHSPAGEATLHLARTGRAQSMTVVVHLLACGSDTRDCVEVAGGEATATLPVVGQGWAEVTVALGPLTALLEDGQVLALLVAAPDVADPPVLAVDTAGTPSRLAGVTVAPSNLVDADPVPASPGRQSTAAAESRMTNVGSSRTTRPCRETSAMRSSNSEVTVSASCSIG